MTKRFVVAVVAGVAFLTGSLVAAQDWPQWRGPTRDGVVAVEGVPDCWPQSLHVAWTVPVLLGRDLLIRDETHLVMLTPG